MHVSIVGYARRDKEDAEFREHLRPFLLKCKGATDAGVNSFLDLCTYRKGGYDSAEAMGRVAAELTEKEAGFDVANRMFYLAIPPSVFVAESASINASARSPTGWTRHRGEALRCGLEARELSGWPRYCRSKRFASITTWARRWFRTS